MAPCLPASIAVSFVHLFLPIISLDLSFNFFFYCSFPVSCPCSDVLTTELPSKAFYYSKNWCWLLSYASIIYSCTSSLSLHIVRCIQAFSTSLQIAFIFFCLTFCHNGVFISYVIMRHYWRIYYPDKLNFPYRSCSTEVPVKLIWHLPVSFASAVWQNVDDDVQDITVVAGIHPCIPCHIWKLSDRLTQQLKRSFPSSFLLAMQCIAPATLYIFMRFTTC